MPRNMAQEKAQHKTPAARRDNRLRKRARRLMEKKGLVRKGDGKEVDHKKMLKSGGSNSTKNLTVTSKRANRKKQPKTKVQSFAKRKK